MPSDVILALDQGSSSTRCVAYDRRMRQRGAAVRRVSTHRPSSGMVEHDADELFAGALGAISEVVGKVEAAVAGIGIASQTESFVLWERDTGRSVTPVVSWQDQRAGELCASIGGRPEAATIRAKTGLALDPTFSAPKLAWLFDADGALCERAEAGEVLFGDIASWLAWHLCGAVTHVTEPSNACRSLLVDLETLRWDGGLLDLFGVPAALLPKIRPSDEPGVHTSGAVIGFEAPLAAMLGDQPAALYGQGCTSPRMATLTLGTGAFLWLNVGGKRPEPPSGVLATAAWEKRASGPTYALEAFCANAGNALDLFPALSFAAAGASRAPDWSRPHPMVVPAPAGLGTPRWHGADRITVLGASSSTTSADLAAAALAGVAHQIADALEAVDADRSADVLRVGGGLSAHAGLLQAVADLSGLALEVAADPEATARGIATLAAEAVGLLDGAFTAPAIARRVAPLLDDGGRARERSRWEDALDVHVRVEA
ncbi:MAG: FGGY family carbohydrate kinase [Gaiellaceae bacterium]